MRGGWSGKRLLQTSIILQTARWACSRVWRKSSISYYIGNNSLRTTQKHWLTHDEVLPKRKPRSDGTAGKFRLSRLYCSSRREWSARFSFGNTSPYAIWLFFCRAFARLSIFIYTFVWHTTYIRLVWNRMYKNRHYLTIIQKNQPFVLW